MPKKKKKKTGKTKILNLFVQQHNKFSAQFGLFHCFITNITIDSKHNYAICLWNH